MVEHGDHMRILLLGFLAACDTSATIGNDTAGGGDTADTGENISDSGDTADSADTADSGDTGAAEATVAWDVTGDYTDLVFSLVSINIGDTLIMADIAEELPAAARIELAEPPPDDYLVAVPDVPGLYIAYFLGGLHQDDGDGKWDPDEEWYGVATTVTFYLDGVLPTEMIDAGYVAGWNALKITSSGNELGDPLAQPLPVLLNDELVLGGDHDDTIAATDRVTTLSASAFSAGTVPAALDVTDVGDTWSLTLSGEPPSDHFADIDGDGREEAVELALAYTNVGGSYGFDVGTDTDRGFACLDGLPVVGWWFASSTDITELLYLNQAGVALGWNAIQITGSDTAFLTPEDAQSLTLSTSCQLGG